MDKIKALFSKENLKKFFFSFIWLGVLVFGLDLLSKWLIQNNLSENQQISVINNFFFITKSHNLGAAWGMGGDGQVGFRIMWLIISLVMSIGLSIYYYKAHKVLSGYYKASLMLMIGGATGNLIDRAFYWNAIVGFDGVIDWLSFKFGSYYFPTFNIADAALVIGVIILIVLMVVEVIKDAKKKASMGEYKYSPKELEERNKQKESNEDNKD